MIKKSFIFAGVIFVILIASVLTLISVIFYGDQTGFPCTSSFERIRMISEDGLNNGLWETDKNYDEVREDLNQAEKWLISCERKVKSSLVQQSIWDLFAHNVNTKIMASNLRERVETFNLVINDFKTASNYFQNNDLESADEFAQEGRNKFSNLILNEKWK